MLGEGKAGLPLPSPPRASYFSVEDTSDVFGMINSILLQPPLSPDRVGHIGWGGEGGNSWCLPKEARPGATGVFCWGLI